MPIAELRDSENVCVRWLLFGPLGKEYQNPVDMVTLSHTVAAQVASAEHLTFSPPLSTYSALGTASLSVRASSRPHSWTRVNSVVLHTDLSTHT